MASPCRLVVNNSTITDAKRIANTLNDYFATIGSKLASTIPEVSKSYREFVGPFQCNSFYLSPTTPEEIEQEINNLNSNKSTCPYSIPVKLIKILKYFLSHPLNLLFNCSFSMGVVPDKIKIARVIPIHKGGSQAVESHYRPISLLSIFNKIIEKLMYKRLMKYLDKYNILNETQFGFRNNRSTTQAILMITDKIQRAIKDKLDR